MGDGGSSLKLHLIHKQFILMELVLPVQYKHQIYKISMKQGHESTKRTSKSRPLDEFNLGVSFEPCLIVAYNASNFIMFCKVESHKITLRDDQVIDVIIVH